MTQGPSRDLDLATGDTEVKDNGGGTGERGRRELPVADREIDAADVPKRDNGHISDKRQWSDLNGNFSPEKTRAGLVESAFHIAECDLAHSGFG